MEVRIEAITAERTSFAPRIADATRSSPSSRHRKMDSRTTIEESTSMPMPRARPPRDMMLSDTEAAESGANVMSSEMGMDTATNSVVTRLRRKR